MSGEYAMIIGMCAGGTLFAVGGTGYKWARRFLLPAIWALLCFIMGFNLIKCCLIFAGYAAVFSLGYGESKPYWYKMLVGISYGLPSLVLGFSVWNILIPLIFISLFVLSNTKNTAKDFPWKICEFIFGAVTAFPVAVKFYN